MNLDQISKKYNVSTAFLNSKEDALNVISKSIEDLITAIKKDTIKNEELIYSLKKLSNFSKDVKNSSMH